MSEETYPRDASSQEEPPGRTDVPGEGIGGPGANDTPGQPPPDLPADPGNEQGWTAPEQEGEPVGDPGAGADGDPSP